MKCLPSVPHTAVGRLSRTGAAAILTVTITLLATACSGGGGGPTDPAGPSAAGAASTLTLSTGHGNLQVQPNGHDVDLGAIQSAVERGYDKARAQIGSRADGLRIDGYTIEVMPVNWNLYGQHLRAERVMRMRAGDERVIAHELQHVFAWELRRPSECKTLQDHPGGYDLHCDNLL